MGVEINGKNDNFERPVLVIKKFNRRMALVLPLTKAEKENKYYYKLNLASDDFSSVVLSQVRLVSGERFLRLMKKVPDNTFDEVVQKLEDLLKARINR